MVQRRALIWRELCQNRFLRQILNEAPDGVGPLDRFRDASTLGVDGHYYLQYFGIHRPAYRELTLHEDCRYRIDTIDTWHMTIIPLKGSYSGLTRIDLPAKPYMAIRAQLIDE